MIFAALLLLSLLGTATPRVTSIGSEEVVLAESLFLWDSEDWTVNGVDMKLEHGNKMVKAADEGPASWEFVAPAKFLGNRRAAYGGQLTFRHGFFEYDAAGEDMVGGFDVTLASEAYDLEIGMTHVVPAWSFKSDHTIDLTETAGWVLTNNGGIVSKPDIIRLLSKLSSIRIRGGFYAGHEDSYISNVKLVAGPPDTEPRMSSLKAQKIVAGGRSEVKGADAAPPPPDDEGEEVDGSSPPPPRDEL